MEPLSVAASVIAVLGAASAAGRGLQHVLALRNAPDQVIALLNEVSDLRVVLKTASEIIESRTEKAQECGNLAHIVQRASRSIAELNRLIHHELARGGVAPRPGSEPKVSRASFLRHHGKLKSLKGELVEIKLSLLVAVGTLTLADVSRLKLHTCEVSLVGPHKPEDVYNGVDLVATQMIREPLSSSHLESTAGDQEALSLSRFPAAVSDTEFTGKSKVARTANTTAPGRPILANELVSMSGERKYNGSHIRLEASVLPLRHCNRFCLCKCHIVTNIATPNLLGKVIGRLFIGYIGLPVLSHRTCDRITCQPESSQMRTRIAYLFPTWFALRLIALTIAQASTTFMWTLSFPVVTQPDAPIVVFSSLGSIEKIQALLATKAALLNSVESTANKSPLHIALQGHRTDLAQFLVQHGADILIQDCNNRTPLDIYYENYFTAPTEEKRMMALLPLFDNHDVFGHWNLKYIHLVVLGCSPLDLSTYLPISTEEVDVADSWGRTALMWAAWRADSTSVSILLRYGADAQASSFNGNSVLMYATYGGSTECLRLLLDAGADINHTCHSLVTAPMTEILKDKTSVGVVLRVIILKAGAIEASRHQKFTPLYVAALTSQTDSLIYLVNCGATTDVTLWNCSTPLSVAISLNNHRAVEALIGKGLNLSLSSAFNPSYLIVVAVFGDERTIRIFISARPSIDVNLRDQQGRTARARMNERLYSTDSFDPQKEVIAAAFQQLLDICSVEFHRAHGDTFQAHDSHEDAQDEQEDAFYDALEDNGSQGSIG